MYMILYLSFRSKIKQAEELQYSSFDKDCKDTESAVDSMTEFKIKTQAQRQAIMKMLVYPTVYTLLWIPGIINRLAETTNQSEEVMQVTGFLQFTTQLIGFANAVIYGFVLRK
jgi:hypothetical protein